MKEINEDKTDSFIVEGCFKWINAPETASTDNPNNIERSPQFLFCLFSLHDSID